MWLVSEKMLKEEINFSTLEFEFKCKMIKNWILNSKKDGFIYNN